MSVRPHNRRHERGVTLIEALIAMGVLLVAGLALAALQVNQFRSARFGDRMLQADTLANDLAENIKLWPYDDTRLAATATVTSTSDSSIKWDLGRNATPSPTPQYSDANLGTTFRGLPVDVDRDGVADFQRYWTVYAVKPGAIENGKLIQIFVRWKESGTGGANNSMYRQVSTFTFRRNPGSAY